MGTVIRSEISKKNPYYISKHRYLELKHFCLQYPTWKRAYYSLDGLVHGRYDNYIHTSNISDPTYKCVEARDRFKKLIDMVESSAIKTDITLSRIILIGITEGLSYEKLKARLDFPCGKTEYYKLYRKFFWILNETQNIHLL